MTAPGEPRWLTDEEMQAWLPLIRLVTLLPQVLDRQLRDDAGLTHVQYLILARLSMETDRQLRMSELANACAISLSRLSHAVATLEHRGWVTRTSAEDDGRGQLAVLTDEGQKLLELAAPGHVAVVRRAVFDGFDDDDVARLAELARYVVKHLESLITHESRYGAPPGAP